MRWPLRSVASQLLEVRKVVVQPNRSGEGLGPQSSLVFPLWGGRSAQSILSLKAHHQELSSSRPGFAPSPFSGERWAAPPETRLNPQALPFSKGKSGGRRQNIIGDIK
jgi:hypothetical protein